MNPPSREQVARLQNGYWDLLEENAELKTSVLEKDELIARLRRQLNVLEVKLKKLVDPDMFLASSLLVR